MTLPSSSQDQLLANLQASTTRLIQGFHIGTPDALLPNTSPTFTYHLHPATIDMQPMTRTDFVDFWQIFIAPNISNFDAEIHIESYDVKNCRSTIYLSSSADTPLGPGTWRNEAVFLSQFGEDGKTLLRVDELLDSAFLKDFQAKLQALEK